MNDFTLLEKLKIFIDVILSSPLFLILIFCAALLIVFFTLKITLNKKINKYAFLGCWVVMLFIIFIKYIKIFFELIDNMFNMIFEALYFPSLSVYLVILVISNFFLIYSVISKNVNRRHKFVNILSAVIIDFLLIVIMEIVNKNDISIYDKLTLYSNKNLLVLLELSTSIFTSWILLNLLISAHIKLKKFDKNRLPELIFDE